MWIIINIACDPSHKHIPNPTQMSGIFTLGSPQRCTGQKASEINSMSSSEASSRESMMEATVLERGTDV
jgi:hypothetical protein